MIKNAELERTSVELEIFTPQIKSTTNITTESAESELKAITAVYIKECKTFLSFDLYPIIIEKNIIAIYIKNSTIINKTISVSIK